jgi:hypothetical protein
MDRKQLTTGTYAAMIALAAIAAASPMIFQLCEAPMHCVDSYRAILGLCAFVTACSVAAIITGNMKARRYISLGTLVAGLFIILVPSVLIGVCGSTKMACNYGLKPVWNLAGGAIMLASLINLYASKEVED